MAADVAALEEVETVLGKYVSIRIEGDNVYINDARVVLTDIMADNGVIHVIDTVLFPPEGSSSDPQSFLPSKEAGCNVQPLRISMTLKALTFQ